MLNLREFMHDVHQNAVAHGWWDAERGERSVRALIVSEWSEALEEARAGRSLVWHACKTAQGDEYANPECESYWDCMSKKQGRKAESCPDYMPKPEGIAIELMDGCIRILDWLGHEKAGLNVMPPDMQDVIRIGVACIKTAMIRKPEMNGGYNTAKNMPVDVLVDLLTERTMMSAGGYGMHAYAHALCIACAWVDAHGEAPEKLLLLKHRYNMGRPYKHGKKF